MTRPAASAKKEKRSLFRRKLTLITLFVLAISLALPGGASAALITNGGFETGDFTGWDVGGGHPTPVISGFALSGTHSALLGTPGTNGTEPLGDSWISQLTPVLPSGALLSYDYWTQTTDSITFDWQDVYVQSASHVTLATVQHEDSTHGWSHVDYDLSSWAGQAVRITFLVHQDGFGDLTSMYVDNVDISSGVPEPASASLFLLGIGAIALALHRRKRAA